MRKAARWLAQTHHHDWGLLAPVEKVRRVREVEQQFGPFVEALLHINVNDRMEAMGMERASSRACELRGMRHDDGRWLFVEVLDAR